MKLTCTLMFEFDKNLTRQERETIKENINALLNRGVDNGLITAECDRVGYEGQVLDIADHVVSNWGSAP